MLLIVPNELRDAINARLDVEFAKCKDAEKDQDASMPAMVREALYQQLLEYFSDHGVIPDFNLERKETDNAQL